MKAKTLFLIAGVINLLVALLHTIGGQLDLVNPLLDSNLTNQAKSEWLGAWHIITIVLFASSLYLLKTGLGKYEKVNIELLRYIAILYVLFGIPFILSSMYLKILAPQWILLMPIGLLTWLGLRKSVTNQ